MSASRNTEAIDPRERFALYRLCDCPTCEGSGKERHPNPLVGFLDAAGVTTNPPVVGRCPDCRGEGRIRQELVTCGTPEAVGVALVTLAREGEFSECPIGLLDRMPKCETCDATGAVRVAFLEGDRRCPECKGSGVKPSGTWLILPWLPSARNVSDAGRTLARSKRPASDIH